MITSWVICDCVLQSSRATSVDGRHRGWLGACWRIRMVRVGMGWRRSRPERGQQRYHRRAPCLADAGASKPGFFLDEVCYRERLDNASFGERLGTDERR